MFKFEDKFFNAKNVLWLGDIKEVKRYRPKAEKSGDNELPPVFNFSFKIGFDTFKSVDYDNRDDCLDSWSVIRDAIITSE